MINDLRIVSSVLNASVENMSVFAIIELTQSLISDASTLHENTVWNASYVLLRFLFTCCCCRSDFDTEQVSKSGMPSYRKTLRDTAAPFVIWKFLRETY